MAWVKLNNVYMNSTSSSTSSYTYTTTTAVSTDRYTTTYNNTLSSGIYNDPILYYNIMSASYTMDWGGGRTSGNTFTISSRGMSLSLSKNTTLTSNSNITESLVFDKYVTVSAESWYKSFSSNSNSFSKTSWSKGVMCYDSLIELEELNTYYTTVTAGTVSKTINDFFKQNCEYHDRAIAETVYLSYTYMYKNQISSNSRFGERTTLTVGYGTNTHTESYADGYYTDSVYFTESSYALFSTSLSPYYDLTANITTSSSTIYNRQWDDIIKTTSICRISTTRIFTNTTFPYTTTLTSTR